MSPAPEGGWPRSSLEGSLERYVSPLDTGVIFSPVRPRPAIVLRILAILPAAFVHVVDLRSGRQVAVLEPSELAPEGVVSLAGSLLATTTREGSVETWRLRGHLRVVSDD